MGGPTAASPSTASRPAGRAHDGPAWPAGGAGLIPGSADIPWKRMAAATMAVAVAIVLVPGWSDIPPLVESDYCYSLTAANRFVAGEGLTATPPVAPFQPWDWSADWAVLTQWPAGYPVLIAGLRKLLGTTALEACRVLNVLACAAALVGWFVFVWRASPADSARVGPAMSAGETRLSPGAPAGLTRLLLAGVAAGAAVSAGSLVNPSTDVIVTAALPWLMLGALPPSDRLCRWLGAVSAGLPGKRGGNGCRTANEPSPPPPPPRRGGFLRGRTDPNPAWLSARSTVLACAACGCASGLLVWFRYSAVFVPAALGGWVLYTGLRRRTGMRPALVFALGAAGPVVALIVLNRVLGPDGDVQSQVNLGRTVGFAFSLELLVEAWHRFTAFGFYAHHAFVPWAMFFWPFVLLLAALVLPKARAAVRRFVGTGAASMSIAVVATLLLMLIAATTLFSEKYEFVGLNRYYQPIKPLYFVLFVSPLLLVPSRMIRVGMCVGLWMMGAWMVQQDWQRTLTRWADADRAVAPSGAWSRSFEPDAAALYGWLRGRESDDLVVASNYHEYITLETGVPALPIPPDRATLDDWLARIEKTRGVRRVRVFFVLDPDNRWRSHWIPPVEEIVARFGLRTAPPDAPPCGAMIREYEPRAGSIRPTQASDRSAPRPSWPRSAPIPGAVAPSARPPRS